MDCMKTLSSLSQLRDLLAAAITVRITKLIDAALIHQKHIANNVNLSPQFSYVPRSSHIFVLNM